MNRKNDFWIRMRLTIAVLIGVVALAGCGPKASEMPPPLPDVDRDNPLKLSVETTKQTYVLGEPVYLVVRLQNTGQRPRPILPLLRPEDGLVGIHITGPDKKRFLFAPPGDRDASDPPVELPAKGAVSAVFPVFFGRRRWTFPNSGTYQVVAVYQWRKTQLVSAPTSVVVAQKEKEGGQLLLDQDAETLTQTGKFLTWQGGDHLKKGKAFLQDLQKRHPRSTLASYARLALGKSYSRHFKDFQAGRVRLPDWKKAQSYLEQVDVKVLPINLTAQLRIAEAKCYLHTGNKPLAARRLAEVRQIAKTRPEYRPLLPQVERLAKAIQP